MRSASPSNAMPSSAPVRRTASWRSSRFSGTVGSGWWLGKVPSDSQKSGVTSAPSAWRVETAMTLPDAVAAVGDDLDRPRQLVPGDDRFPIASEHRIVGSLVSLPAAPALRDDDLPQPQDLVPVKRLAAEHHLEAVELGRIVGAGDLHPAVGLQGGDGEVECRRRQRAHVHRGATRVGDAETHALRQARAGGPVVTPDRDHGRAAETLPRRRWRRRGPVPGRSPG